MKKKKHNIPKYEINKIMSIQSKDSHVFQKSRDSTANHIFLEAKTWFLISKCMFDGHRILNMKRMLLELFYSGEKELENGSNFVTQKYIFSHKLLLVDF